MRAWARRAATSRVLQGMIATILIVVISILVVGRGTGMYDRRPMVSTILPTNAGFLIGNEFNVRYLGATIGKTASVDQGVEYTHVDMRIDGDALPRIPRGTTVRVAPRTIFGDTELVLVPPESPPGPGLQPGDVLAVDASDEAVQLYGLYDEVMGLVHALNPADLNVALTALAQAFDGRGNQFGELITRSANFTDSFAPAIGENVIRDFSRVARNFDGGTPDTIAAFNEATLLSERILPRRDRVPEALEEFAGLFGSVSTLFGPRANSFVVVVKGADGGPAFSTPGTRGTMLSEVLQQLVPVGEAAAPSFRTGRFNIVAVPDFSDPMPYTANECPQYPGLSGPTCPAPGVVVPPRQSTPSTVREIEAIPGNFAAVLDDADVVRMLEDELTGPRNDASANGGSGPSAAANMLLRPLIRGNIIELLESE
ncbi:MCE family protein [Hoyosella sp. YIM 151337]|uniref:MCE family protein n=1 Tax=Hoyosella sp. YIM 151337 TaxID=2992742 RepID=UPI00223672CA|nr:MCE family protein [Hoyosella sp. YIM 151337]MCW4355985.1 MCE family protein [Hoyosella sp. YIM 151337]